MTTMTMKPVPLDEHIDEAVYGGKAAQLAAAARVGLPVPRGVALPVEIVDSIVAADAVTLDELKRAIAALAWPLAVRSSAVGEDAAVASFAGQHLTRLNVCSPAALLEAVLDVFASARSESALAYRSRLGVEGEPRIGVVVQELVMADRAGVLFSCNPITGAHEIIVEAAWGLGEAVVAGLVTPDRYRLTPGGRVLERTIGLKDVAVHAAPDGGTRQTAVVASLSRASCLDDADLERLWQLASRCDETFGGGQDLEWAFGGEQLYLLQRRPITKRGSTLRG
jgi:pyruvate,water dikinase